MKFHVKCVKVSEVGTYIYRKGDFYADSEFDAIAQAEEEWSDMIEDLENQNAEYDFEAEEEWGND